MQIGILYTKVTNFKKDHHHAYQSSSTNTIKVK